MDILPNCTMDYMLKMTKIKGADLLIKAIDSISQGKIQAFYPKEEGSYYSFPTPESYKNFKKCGYKLW